jgi:sigma-B regulation protein RsbU (phosphoserine phosphatase)
MRGETRQLPTSPADRTGGRARAAARKPGSRIRRLSMLRFLADSAQDLNSSLALQDVFRKIAERVRFVIDYHLFCVMLWNERTQLLDHSFTLCLGEPGHPPGKGFPLGHGLSGTAAALRRSIRVADVRADSRYVRYRHPEVDIRSELVVPILFQGRLIGVLDVESMQEGTFTEEHEEMLSALASQMATALQNARLFETVVAKERRFA